MTEEAVALARPDLIIAPFLKRRIPESVWRHHRCIVMHPGIVGDRGPSALDWAIVDGETRWGVTALEANADMDAGDVWASVEFPMRDASKSSLYRNEVTEAAVVALHATLERLARGEAPRPLAQLEDSARGRARPLMRQRDRALDWRRDDTATVLRKIRAADGSPGVADELRGDPVHLFDAHREGRLRARFADAAPGTVIAQRDGAVLRRDARRRRLDHARLARRGRRARVQAAGGDGARGRLAGVPEIALPPEAVVDHPTWRPIDTRRRARSATCIFRSTTVRCGPNGATRCGPRTWRPRRGRHA